MAHWRQAWIAHGIETNTELNLWKSINEYSKGDLSNGSS